ncbi:hypothetical protein ACFLXC_00445 [Chloroflexota bacterium]
MKILKGFALAVLGIVLFLSISIFGTVFLLDNTVFKADFMTSNLNKLDISAVVTEEMSKQVPPDFQSMMPAVDEIISDAEPWIKQQAALAIKTGYDYLQGRSPHLNIVVDLNPVIEKIKPALSDAIILQLPPEVKQLPTAQMEQYVEQYYQQLVQQIPTSLSVNENNIPPDLRAIFDPVRQGFIYYQITYWGLVGLMVLLTLLIILIHRSVRGETRILGIIFLVYGAIQYAGLYALKAIGLPQLPLSDMPSAVQAWLPQFLREVVYPLELYSLGFLIAGIILLVVSFVYPKREEEMV